MHTREDIPLTDGEYKELLHTFKKYRKIPNHL